METLRKFVAPEIVIGVGALALAGRYARNLGARNVFLVSDPGVVQAGWTEAVIGSLEAASLKWTLFTDLTSNPRAEEIMAGAAYYDRQVCDVIVAVGGGSPMDCAKAIGISATLKERGLKKGDIPQLARIAINDPCMATNPIAPTINDIETVYAQAF